MIHVDDFTTGFAAIAALASWASVGLTSRGQRRAEEPRLSWGFRAAPPVALTADPVIACLFDLENVGRGPALAPSFFVYDGHGHAVSQRHLSTLASGEKVTYRLPFLTTKGAYLVVYCEDRRNKVQVWADDYRHETYARRARKNKPITVRRIISDLKLPHSEDSFVIVPATVEVTD